MDLLVLYDERGFDAAETRFFTNIGEERKLKATNREFYMGVTEGSNSVPVLYFPSAQEEDFFFKRIKNGILAFTTLPREKLKFFDNQYFQDSSKIYKIKCIVQPGTQGGEITPYRWIEFRLETTQPVGSHSINSLVKNSIEHPDKNLLYKTYINPIPLSVPEHKLESCYHTLLLDKNDFPIALPPVKESPVNTYFGNCASGGNIAGFLPHLRRQFRNTILSYDKCDKTCLFVKLWEMTDDPCFSEFLKDGAYFSFQSIQLNTTANEPQESAGYPFISFHYPGSNIYPGDLGKEWKCKLIEPACNKDDQVSKVTEAVCNDLLSGIPGERPGMARAAKILEREWDKTTSDAFNTTRAREEQGWWTKIEKLANGMNEEIRKFIHEFVLGPSEARGQHLHDHDLALQLFSQYLCKCPFEDVPTYPENWSFGRRPDFYTEWQLLFIDFVLSRGNLPPGSIDAGIVTERGKCTYESPLSPQQIFRLRLLLPADTEVRSIFTNILNFPNALNYNFVL